MIYICVHGCGEIKVKDMYQDEEALKDGAKLLFCPECKESDWFIIPEGDEFKK